MDYGNAQKFDLDEYNLNTNEWDANPGRDPRAIGSNVISSATTPNALPSTPNALPGNPDTMPGNPNTFLRTPEMATTPEASLTPELGQIVPAMPPGYTAEVSQLVQPTQPPLPDFDQSALKTTDTLDARAIKIIDDSIAKLDQDGDIADFYNVTRDMMETHLDNSYNRKLAA